jgi:hypothetical protein
MRGLFLEKQGVAMLLKSTQIQMCYDLVESQIVNFNLQNKHPKGDVRSVDDNDE